MSPRRPLLALNGKTRHMWFNIWWRLMITDFFYDFFFLNQRKNMTRKSSSPSNSQTAGGNYMHYRFWVNGCRNILTLSENRIQLRNELQQTAQIAILLHSLETLHPAPPFFSSSCSSCSSFKFLKVHSVCTRSMHAIEFIMLVIWTPAISAVLMLTLRFR